MSGRSSSVDAQFFYEMPPMVPATGTATATVAMAAGTALVIADLTTMPGTAAKAVLTIAADDYNPNPTGHFVYCEAVGADIYVGFGPTFASLSALSATAVSTVNGTTGAVTLVAGGSFCIPQGKAVRFRIPSSQGTRDNADVGASSPARFIGFLTLANTGILQVYQSSP
jgi:hypothetical protein